MNINIKIIMITATIISTIGGFLLFSRQSYDIQSDHQNIVSILEIPSKADTKINTNIKITENKYDKSIENTNQGIQKYTINLSEERVESMTYIVREDGWIPYYLDPIDINNPYYPALYGEISNEYNLEFKSEISNISELKLKIENILCYEIKNIEQNGSTGVFIRLANNSFTAKEVEAIKYNLHNYNELLWSEINSGILPEYQTSKYEHLIYQSMIPEE